MYHESLWNHIVIQQQVFIRLKITSNIASPTGDIVTVDYCMRVYTQFLNNEPFDFFLATTTEIRDTLDKIDRELMNFRQFLKRLFILFYSLLPKKSEVRKHVHSTEQMFKEDLINQFAKFVIINGKFSTGTYTGLERFFLKIIDKIFLVSKIFCSIKIFF